MRSRSSRSASRKALDFADPQAGLQEQLHQGVVPAGMAVAGGPGGAQQGLDLRTGESRRLPVALGADRSDSAGNIDRKPTGGLGPATQAAHSLQAPVHGGRAQPVPR